MFLLKFKTEAKEIFQNEDGFILLGVNSIETLMKEVNYFFHIFKYSLLC